MSPPSRDLSPRPVAVVTGAGRRRGIGRAMALQLADEGYGVVVHERRSDPAACTPTEQRDGWLGATSVVEEIRAAGGHAVAVAGDITLSSTAHDLVAAAAELGSIAVLVNNHGSAGEANAHLAHGTPGIALGRHLARERRFAAHHHVGRRPRHRHECRGLAFHRAPVVRCGPPSAAPLRRYCVSKAAVERLTEQQALELARLGIRVNCVAPGMTPTDMIDGTLERASGRSGPERTEIEARAVRAIPLRRLATVEDIAEAVVFLAGPRSSYVTGQILTVDGGMTLA